MATVPIPEPSDDACKSGFLSKKYARQVVNRANVFGCHGKVVLPPGAGSGKIMVDDESWVIDLTKASFATAAAIKPLQLIPSGSDVRVVYGLISEWVCDADMDPLEDGTEEHPYFLLSGLTDAHYVYVDLTVSYDGIFWRIDSATITSAASVPSPTSTHAYFELGAVTVSGGVGGIVTRAVQTRYGSPWWVRAGDTASFQDTYLEGT